MPGSNPGSVTPVTTPWSLDFLQDNNAGQGLDDLGFSAYMKTLPSAASALLLKPKLSLDHVVDVRDYGAVLDGVTDDLVAVRAAYAAVVAAGVSYAGADLTTISRPTLYFPKGKCRLSGSVTNGVPCTYFRAIGSDAIIVADGGVTAFEVGRNCFFHGLQFHNGARALYYQCGPIDAFEQVNECGFYGQTTACLATDNTCTGGLHLEVTNCHLFPKYGSAAEILHALSGDSISFHHCYLYAIGTGTAFYVDNVALRFFDMEGVPGPDLVSWVELHGTAGGLFAINSRFGGEFSGADCIVKNYLTASVGYPVVPTAIEILNCAVYTAGQVIRFYAIPNVVRIKDCTGFASTLPCYLDAAIPAADVTNLGGLGSTFEVSGCNFGFELSLDYLTGPVGAMRGIPLAERERRYRSTPDPNYDDYLINSHGWTGAYGPVNSGTAPASTPADSEDPAASDIQYLANADGQSFDIAYTTMLAGLAANTMTAVVTLELKHPADFLLLVQMTAGYSSFLRVLGRGRHTLCLPFYYPAAGPTSVQIACGNMPNGAKVIVERFHVVKGERRLTGKRAMLQSYAGGTAPPPGTWIRGDTMRVLPAVDGGPREWVCTLSGTPGTWSPVGQTGYHSCTAGITAVNPGAQGDGPLVSDINEVSVVANANDAVTAPAAVAGLQFTVINNGANTLEIWPAAGDNLGAGVNTAVTLAAATNVTYAAYNATNWEIV